MAVSGSVDYALTALQCCNEAFEIVGVKGEGSALSDYDLQQGLTTLNLMLKTWSVKLHQWLKTESTITPVASTASYALNPKAYKVLSIRRRRSNIDTPLIQLSREEYYDLPNKSATGVPNSFYYDPQRATGTVYLWPTPNSDFATNGSLLYTYTRQIQDIDAKENDLDLPQEWTEAVVMGLANRLADKYPVMEPMARANLKERAQALFDGLSHFDQEDTSLYFQPGWR